MEFRERGVSEMKSAACVCVCLFVRECECVPAISNVSMRGGGWGGLNILLMSSSGSGGSPLLCRWAFSCVRLWRYWREGYGEKDGGALETIIKQH